MRHNWGSVGPLRHDCNACMFVTFPCSDGRSASPQVESVKLSSESDKRAMQVELANSRREAAAAAAQLKHALANWQVGGSACRMMPT